ncbi:putative 2-aminoethylphosphonate ABC transporter substrate-binding protein [Variovorax sp. UMC13]|uniref:putative 2-aminoethylphosphonate ABC transporter substrate-binding protein n=1 Tax=Variovorax sp. UMC13 TaxID=1862326 RepID=UPI0016044F0B|nr:putative 2-aminoethylphosphonate ABC transporter substrate-binding protein [Variovorax sp. UMC13]MBB1603732.1 putative 2-aminoethylphosphonate ABC transporter substrate-binding protein [Variovorax sp. UMC13]
MTMIRSARRLTTALSIAVTAAIGLAASGLALAQQRTPLLVYTALETDAMKLYKDAFEKANPDIEVKWVRDSTGIVTAKLLAEKANPQADVVAGLAASSLALLAQEGMLQAYEPKGFGALNPAYSDSARPPSWVGMDVWAATVCFNRVEAKKLGLPKPESWQDLAKPIYKGAITMPHPASSGTGYLDVSYWLQNMGEAEGWKYMDALHQNVAQYVHSGSKPCKQAGAGEFPIGISFEFRAHQVKKSGAPVDLVFPKEGLGWDIEATSIMKTSKKMELAKRFADWMATKEANQITANWWAVVAYPGVASKLEGIPENYEKLLARNDLNWAAKNRERILAEWSKRYEGKAEPKP